MAKWPWNKHTPGDPMPCKCGDSNNHFAFQIKRRPVLTPAEPQPAELGIRKATEAMVDAAFKALPADAHGTIGSGEMYRVLDAALAAATDDEADVIRSAARRANIEVPE